MKKMFKYSLISVAAASLFVGCGGGSSSNSSDTNEPTTYSVGGNAVDGYIANATVCFDMNTNLACDATEPSTLSDENGSYTLVISQAQKDAAESDASILVTGGLDIDTNAALVGVLEAPFDGSSAETHVSPLTTVAMSMIKEGTATSTADAYEKVANAFGLTPEEVKEDPVALAAESNNTKVLEATMTLYRSVVALSETTGAEPKEVFSYLGKGLSSVTADENASLGDVLATAIAAADGAPEKLKEAAAIVPVIAGGVEKALTEHTSIKDAALVADAMVDAVKEEVHIAFENNEAIDDTFVTNLENNVEDVATIDPREVAIENLLTTYDIEATKEQIEALASLFTSSSAITLSSIVALDAHENPSIASIVVALQEALTIEEIKRYLADAGVVVDEATAREIASKVPDFTSSMTLETLATKLYATNIPDLMTLALKINPPAGVAALDDITKAKNLFESVRTQVNQAQSFVDSEAQDIDAALTDVSSDVEFTSLVLGHLSDMITQGMDSGASSLTDTVADGNRTITLTQTTSTTDVTWSYSIEDSDGSGSWSGTLIFPNIDPENFDPSSFTTLRVTLDGTLPVTYYGETLPAGKTNTQSVSLHAELTKTSEGAHFKLDENLTNNGNSVAITDANVAIGYTVDSETKEPNIDYVKVENLYVNGTVQNYALDGKIDVSYTQNSRWATNGFEKEFIYSGFGAQLQCDGDVTNSIDPTAITLNYEGKTYTIGEWVNSDDVYYRSDLNKTMVWFGFNDITVELGDGSSVEDPTLYSGIESCVNPQIYIHNTWTDHDNEMYNSGYLPSQINFSGKLSNTQTGAYLSADINATWSDVATANLDDDNYEPSIDVRAVGKLSMPESPVMTIDTHYTNSATTRNIDLTYVNGDVSITATTSMSVMDESAIVNVESTTGVKAVIFVDSDGNVDYSRSKVTDAAGNLIGNIEDRSGAPVVTYADGTFESLF